MERSPGRLYPHSRLACARLPRCGRSRWAVDGAGDPRSSVRPPRPVPAGLLWLL